MELTAGQINSIRQFKKYIRNSGYVFGAFGGFAARAFGSERLLTDIDILLDAPTTFVDEVCRLLEGESTGPGKFLCDGFEFQTTPLRMKGGDRIYHWDWCSATKERLVPVSLNGENLYLLPKEEILLTKLILRRGEERGKFDLLDCANILKSEKLVFDWNFFWSRVDTFDARERVEASLMLID